jgi:hypothetical protein
MYYDQKLTKWSINLTNSYFKIICNFNSVQKAPLLTWTPFWSNTLGWHIKAVWKCCVCFAVFYIWSGRNLSLPASKMCIEIPCNFLCYLLNVQTFDKYTMRNSQKCNTVSQIHWPKELASKYSKVNWLLGNPVLQVHFKRAVGIAILGS